MKSMQHPPVGNRLTPQWTGFGPEAFQNNPSTKIHPNPYLPTILIREMQMQKERRRQPRHASSLTVSNRLDVRRMSTTRCP